MRFRFEKISNRSCRHIMKHTPGSFSVRFPNTAVRRSKEAFRARPPHCPNRKVALSETVSKSDAERTDHTRVRKTVAFVLNCSDASLRREEKNRPHFRKKFKNRRTFSEEEPLIADAIRFPLKHNRNLYPARLGDARRCAKLRFFQS